MSRPVDPQPATALRPVLGFWQLTASGVGLIVGAGVYVLIGTATREAGGGVWLSFALAALLSALTAMSYCELAAMFPRAGAEYDYTRHAYPQPVAFVVGWVMIAGLVVAAAAVALGFGQYLRQFFDLDVHIGGLLLLAGATLVAMTGIQSSVRLTVVLSAVQVGGLLIVIALGASHVTNVDFHESAGPGGVLAGAALVFFAFIGFDEVITLSEETRDATRTVPRALLTALGISTALYVAVAIVSLGVLGPARLAASPRPLADVIADVTGGRSAGFVAGIALASTANTTLLALTAASRLTYGMASSGALPSVLAKLSRNAAPAAAIGLCASIAVVFAVLGGIDTVASVTDFAVYVVFLAVNSTVILLRIRQPATPRPFRAGPGPAKLPLPAVLGIVATVAMMSQLDRGAVLIGTVVLLAGVAAATAIAAERRLHRHRA